jgi:glycosyltransferase involved in cell wall biosynthesis
MLADRTVPDDNHRGAVAYILPVHNSADTIGGTARQIASHFTETKRCVEIVLIENASTDDSRAACSELASLQWPSGVIVRTSHSDRGLGNAWREGMRFADAPLVVLTADDLPFSFTDLDAYDALSEPVPLAIGSKAHAESLVDVSPLRRLLSSGFRLLRRALLKVQAGDTQGSLIVARELLERVRPYLRCSDYLISTEIVAAAVKLGIEPVELPVTYLSHSQSSVSPFMDSLRMAMGLFRLRARLKHVQ